MKLFDLDQKKNIESLISEGQTLEAIALIKTLAGEKSLMGKIAIALEARLSVVRRDEILGLITSEQKIVEINKINSAIIEVSKIDNLRSLEKVFQEVVATAKSESTSKSGFFLTAGVFYALGLIIYGGVILTNGNTENGIFILCISIVLSIFSILRGEGHRRFNLTLLLTATILIIIDLSIDWYNSFNKSVPKESEFLDVDSWRNQTLKQLKIECHLDSEGYVCGRVINNSADEVSFLKVSVRLINDQGNSIQADSGYVDGAEVSIKPGDSRPFCIHISNYKKNIDNISYSCEILDFH